MRSHCLLLSILMSAAGLSAETHYPAADWQDAPDPLASPNAVVGGEFRIFAGQYPKSLNYLLDNNMFTYQVFSSMYETLLGTDPITAEYTPMLASAWSISDDKKTFTFQIDTNAVWSDGRAITARDVQWTYDTILDDKNLTGVHKVSLENFARPEIAGSNLVRFTAKEVHWRNLAAAGGFPILPRHAFEGMDFNKIHFEFPVISGPYRLGELRERVFLKMERRPDWWAWRYRRFQNTGNFETLNFRFFAERSNAFEAFKQGLIDMFPIYTARLWVKETSGEKFEKNWILKQRVENFNPIGFQGFAMNMRRPPFNDLNVRKAMTHLIDREKMNKTLMHSQYFMHRSYYENLYSADTPCENPYAAFDKDAARELLAESGWRANPDTGILEKDGREFTFKFLTRDPSSEKFLAIFAEDLKDIGIRFEIDKKDLAAWMKDMDKFNFDMTWAAWGGSLRPDPEGMWLSREADRVGGNNVTGFRDDRVDRIIEEQKSVFDIHRRQELLRELDRILTAESPYALLWNINATRLVYWNKFGTPDTVLSKYGDERSAYAYWWFDEDSAADLEDAMDTGAVLPGCPSTVTFEDVFAP